MKFSLVYLVFGLIGVVVVWYTFANQPIIDWERFIVELEETGINTQAEAEAEFRQALVSGQALDFVNRDALVLLTFGVFSLVAGLIGGVHIAIDKLFFKKFFEQPNLARATRRALMWGILPVLLIFLAVQNLLTGSVVALSFAGACFAELALSTMRSSIIRLTEK